MDGGGGLSPVAGALVELATPRFPEIRHGAELAHDGSARVPSSHEPLQSGVGIFFVRELLDDSIVPVFNSIQYSIQYSTEKREGADNQRRVLHALMPPPPPKKKL